MKFQLVVLAISALASWTAAAPIPQTTASCPSNISIQRRQTTGATVGTILTSDPCPPSTYSTQVAQIDTDRATTASVTTGTATIESFGSWWHKTWDKIRNAVKSIKINITIPWDTLVNWIDKIAAGWSTSADPDDSTGNTVMLLPPNGDRSQALYWHPPVTTIPKDPPCGGPTQPGKPAKMCP